MAKAITIWDTVTERRGVLYQSNGIEFVGKEIRAVGDNSSIQVSTSGIGLIPGLSDAWLAQITSANKVAGSAVQLQALNAGGLADNSGLGLVIDTDMFTFDGTSGLQLDFNPAEFQFVPGTGLIINAVPIGKLPSNLALTDADNNFSVAQSGVAASAGDQYTTLDQVNVLVGGGSFETLLNLSGQNIQKGWLGYIENVSGGVFRLARADDPSTAKVQYAASESINDGASGSFYSVPSEIDDVLSFVSGADIGDNLYLSTTVWGGVQNPAPSVSGETVLKIGFRKRNDNGFSFNPEEPIDL